MRIIFDPEKSNKNNHDRGLPFHLTIDFDWETALYAEDCRYTYTERRFVALGYLNERLHIICFTYIPGGIRIISFRKANRREVKRYEKEIINK